MRSRPAIVLAIVAALVVLLAVAAAVVSRGRERPTLDPATPDGVVQLYATALFDNDVEGALEYLDPDLGCADPLPEVYLPDAARLSVTDTATNGDTATVELRVEEGGGWDSMWSHDQNFSLRRDEGTWLITGEPWPIYECR